MWAPSSWPRARPTRGTKCGSTTYAGDGFAATVAEVLELADRIGPDLPGPEAWRTRDHFVTTVRYEWMFWDAAWRLESWPV